jgi:hypothetical protein
MGASKPVRAVTKKVTASSGINVTYVELLV